MNNKLKWILWFVFSAVLIGLPYLIYDIKGQPEQITGKEWIHLSFLENRFLYFIHHGLAGGPVFVFGIILNMFAFRKVFMKAFLPAIAIVSFVFVIWDILFTRLGIWLFDKNYHLGVYVFNLPLEEYLWFLVIPFCGMFVYHVCEQYISIRGVKDNYWKAVLLLIVIVLYLIGMDKLYTAESLAVCASVIMMGLIWGIPKFGLFLASFGLILIPMFIFNGMLTGLFTRQACVVYNSQEFSNFRVLSFPVEDISFGFGLLYGIICLKYLLKC